MARYESILEQSNGKISPKEFDYPELVMPQVFRELVNTRMLLGIPMYFTKSSNGRTYHPNGDAVASYSDSHSEFSLHKAYINHAESIARREIIKDQSSLGKAIDWDAGARSNDELFDQYLLLAQKTGWTGIGVYPFWNRKGFHTDLRSARHPSFKAHWFRDASGAYHSMTLSNWKEHVDGKR